MSENIYALIPKVMADVGSIGKTRKNEQQSYMFRGIEDMYQAAHPALIKHGVFCCPQVLEYITEERIMKNGSPASRVLLKISHKFYAPDGSFVEVVTMGEGIDTSDKASNKAMSAAMKYAFIELFSIPTQDIEDSDRTTPESTKGKADIAPPVTLTRPEPVKIPAEPVLDPEFDFIPAQKSSYLSRRFRESLKEEHQHNADELRHQALIALSRSGLFKSKFIDASGNPTQEFILKNEYEAIGKELVRAAKSI